MAPGGGGDCAGSAQAAASTSAAAVASTSGSKGGGGTAGAMKKGPWTAAEDAILIEYVRKHGEGNWNAVQKNCGLSRCGKSCRLRWANHLRPNLKKGPFSPDEERLILELHSKLGNKWARMAAQLPGRTDNEIKNYWNTRIKRRQRAGLPLYPPDIQHHATFLHHHHHHRQPTSALNAASLSEHKALYSASVGATPLSLLDPINFAALTSAATATTPAASPTFLGLGHHAPFLVPSTSQKPLKRLRDDADTDAGGFYLPFHAATTHHVAPPPSSQDPFFTFNSLAGFDLGPPPPIPQQHSGDNHHPSGFPVKLELPSSQLLSEPCRPIAPFDGLPPLGSSNSELLDALLRDTQAMVGDDGKGGEASCFHQRHDRLPRDGGDGELSQGLALGSVGGKWDDPDHHSANVVPKREAAEDAGAVEDDLSALLDLIPMAPAAAREWHKYNSDSAREVSGVTDENLGPELHHLASSSLSTAVAEENHSWSVGSRRWNDAPASC